MTSNRSPSEESRREGLLTDHSISRHAGRTTIQVEDVKVSRECPESVGTTDAVPQLATRRNEMLVCDECMRTVLTLPAQYELIQTEATKHGLAPVELKADKPAAAKKPRARKLAADGEAAPVRKRKAVVKKGVSEE